MANVSALAKPQKPRLRATELSGKASFFRYEHPFAFRALVSLTVVIALISLFAVLDPAWADILSDIDVTKWPENIYNSAVETLKGAAAENLTNNFQSLLGENSGAYDAMKKINSTVIKPIAASIVAIVFLVGCFDVANKFEANGALAPFKEVVFLLIGAAICVGVINKSLDFCQAIFDMFSAITNSVLNDTGLGQLGADTWDLGSSDDAFGTTTAWIAKFLLAFVFLLGAMVMNVVTYFAILGRACQALIYAAVSPIALAFFGNDHTRQWAVGFCKSFIALGLAGVIMAAMVVLAPLAFKAVNTNILGTLAVIMVFIKGMTSAGSWAKEILGG